MPDSRRNDSDDLALAAAMGSDLFVKALAQTHRSAYLVDAFRNRH